MSMPPPVLQSPAPAGTMLALLAALLINWLLRSRLGSRHAPFHRFFAE